MADGISITDLEQKTEVTDNDNFAVDNGAITNKVTAKQIKDYMGPTYVKKAGDTMTGPLIVPDVSSGSNDNTVINSKWANGLFIKKAGDTMTGALKVPSPEFSANDTTVPNTAWVRALITGKTVVKDYITERFSDENGNWYELYASGWIKQGGLIPSPSGTITFLKPYTKIPLNVNMQIIQALSGSTGLNANWFNCTTILDRSKTGFNYGSANGSDIKRMWFAEGI